MIMTEEERTAGQEYLEEKQHEKRLRHYHWQIQNLIGAFAFLIRCIAFYIAARGIGVLATSLLEHKKFSRRMPN